MTSRLTWPVAALLSVLLICGTVLGGVVLVERFYPNAYPVDDDYAYGSFYPDDDRCMGAIVAGLEALEYIAVTVEGDDSLGDTWYDSGLKELAEAAYGQVEVYCVEVGWTSYPPVYD